MKSITVILTETYFTGECKRFVTIGKAWIENEQIKSTVTVVQDISERVAQSIKRKATFTDYKYIKEYLYRI